MYARRKVLKLEKTTKTNDFFGAVEDYNKTVTNPKRRHIYDIMTLDELKGILYNTLRRRFSRSFRKGRNYYNPNLNMGDLECTFNKDLTIKNIKINKPFNNSNDWWSDETLKNYLETKNLKEIINTQKELYPSKTLNELAFIVNQL
jgi:hypothetical protein